jgi:hypothetical protein
MVDTPSATAATLSTSDPTVLRADADPADALSWFESKQYGLAPVRTDAGDVIGYVPAAALAAAETDGSLTGELRDHAEPFAHATVLGPETDFGEVVDALAREPFCFVADGGAVEGVPDGVLTRTDLNSPAAFVHCYGALFAFETRLRALVAESDTDWKGALHTEQVERIEERVAVSDSGAHDPLHYTSLTMLAQVAQRTASLRESLGFDSENEAKERLSGLVELRNDVCHSRDLVHARGTELFEGRDAVALADAYGLLVDLVDRLSGVTEEGAAGVPRAEGETPPPVWDGSAAT